MLSAIKKTYTNILSCHYIYRNLLKGIIIKCRIFSYRDNCFTLSLSTYYIISILSFTFNISPIFLQSFLHSCTMLCTPTLNCNPLTRLIIVISFPFLLPNSTFFSYNLIHLSTLLPEPFSFSSSIPILLHLPLHF